VKTENIFCFTIVIISFMIATGVTIQTDNKEFAKTECAQYNPLNGEFEIINKEVK